MPVTDSEAQNSNNLLSLDEHRNVIVTSNAQVAQQKNAQPSIVTFDRSELDAILYVYGFKVGSGEWRDYAIDHLKDCAIFSVYRRTGEVPEYRIEKDPKLARKQGAYSIIASNAQDLKRGQDLKVLLRYFDKRPKLVSI